MAERHSEIKHVKTPANASVLFLVVKSGALRTSISFETSFFRGSFEPYVAPHKNECYASATGKI